MKGTIVAIDVIENSLRVTIKIEEDTGELVGNYQTMLQTLNCGKTVQEVTSNPEDSTTELFFDYAIKNIIEGCIRRKQKYQVTQEEKDTAISALEGKSITVEE